MALPTPCRRKASVTGKARGPQSQKSESEILMEVSHSSWWIKLGCLRQKTMFVSDKLNNLEIFSSSYTGNRIQAQALYPLTMNLSEAGIKGKSYSPPGQVGPVVGSSNSTGHKSHTSQNWFCQNVLKKVLPPCWWGCGVDCRPSWWHVVRLSLIRRQSFTKVHRVARLIPYQLLPIMWWTGDLCKFDISHLYDANSIGWTDLISLNKTKPSVLWKYDYPLWSLTHLHSYKFWMNQALL